MRAISRSRQVSVARALTGQLDNSFQTCENAVRTTTQRGIGQVKIVHGSLTLVRPSADDPTKETEPFPSIRLLTVCARLRTAPLLEPRTANRRPDSRERATGQR
jgi:hypothetical protein